jgi:NAD(P)-dependent dehydrogenase (short-subunit alcohol dehydrogenase family)
MYLQNTVAVVTGGTDGIGKGIAAALAAYGCKVAIIGRNIGKGEAAVKDLKQITDHVAFFQCDVSSVNQINATFGKIVDYFKQIDILVNCAGMPVREFIPEIDEKVWDTFCDTNIKSVFFFSRIVAEHIKKRASGFGRIVNISSVRADLFDENHTGYSLSKAAINTLTKCFAVCYAADGITTNAIAPGFVTSGMTSYRFTDESALEIIKSITPIHRMITDSEVGELASYLCSKQAGAVNGQVIKIDGGGISYSGLYS